MFFRNDYVFFRWIRGFWKLLSIFGHRINKYISLETIFMKRFLLFLSLCLFFLPFTQAQIVGLVLSGGGAKGMPHIGIIRALEENNIAID